MTPENDNPIEAVPEGWSIRQISDLCENLDNLRRPITRSKRVPGSIPYYGANGIQDYVSGYLFDEELVLVAEDCGDYKHFGKTAYVIRGKAWVNNHAHILRCKKINSVFLKEMLNYMNLTQHINMGSRGKLNKADLEKIPIQFPSASEQQKIAEILTTADEEIELTERIIQETELVKRGLNNKLMTQGMGHDNYKETELGRVPESWKEVNLEAVAAKEKNSFVDGPFGSDLKVSDYTAYGVQLIQLQNIGDGIFYPFSDQKYTSEQKFEQLIRHAVYPGELVISKMAEPIARCCMVDSTQTKYLAVADCVKLKVDKSRYDPLFVMLLINSSKFRRLAYSRGTGTTRRRIGLTELKGLPFIEPPLEEQKEISHTLTLLDNKIAAEKMKMTHLETLKKGLMRDLLSGKVRVS